VTTATQYPTAPERLSVGGDEIALHVTSADTGGTLLAAEVRLPAGGGPPVLHRHTPTEVYRVESGELVIYLEDERGGIDRIVSRHGDVVHIPGGRAHTVRNESQAEATAYVVFTPGEPMEAFVRAAAALAGEQPPSSAQIVALAEAHGIEMTEPVPVVG
jgi:oxalate decarboxylase/phosphoglucose isomerase-like protein (cupin superfamily)